MSRRGVVFLGDLVRTVSLLRPQDTSTATAMARRLALGPGESDRLPRVGCASGPTSGPEAQLDRWGGEAPQPSPVPSAVAEHPPGETDESVQHAYQDGGRQRNASAAPRIPSLDPTGPTNLTPRPAERPIDFSLTLTRLPWQDAPTGWQGAANSDDPSSETARTTRPEVEPPWTPEWARGVMVAAASAPVESRRLDQRALIRKVSRQEVLRAVPWQGRSSTRRGVQLLLDHSSGMAPFQDDRRWLHGLLGSVAGRDRVEVMRFSGCPPRGVVRANSFEMEAYRAPSPGTPVVLVSDLGHVRPPFTGEATARADEWLAFVEGVLRRGCPPVCLTPFPAAAYPSPMGDRIALIPFDRRISLRHAREAVRRIHRLLEERS